MCNEEATEGSPRSATAAGPDKSGYSGAPDPCGDGAGIVARPEKDASHKAQVVKVEPVANDHSPFTSHTNHFAWKFVMHA